MSGLKILHIFIIYVIYEKVFLLYFSDFKPLLDVLGLYFQIRDDYANLYSKEVRHIDTELCVAYKCVVFIFIVLYILYATMKYTARSKSLLVCCIMPHSGVTNAYAVQVL